MQLLAAGFSDNEKWAQRMTLRPNSALLTDASGLQLRRSLGAAKRGRSTAH
jgi:hypothetical protein